MGNVTPSKWEDEYQFVERIDSNRVRVRNQSTRDHQYEVLSLQIARQEREMLKTRIALRQNERSIYVQRIIRCCEREESTLCGDGVGYDIICRETRPTLGDHCRYRRLKHRQFNNQQICYVIRSVCLGLNYLRRINEKHGLIDLNNIIVNQEVYIKDPILVERESSESYGYRRKVRGYPSPQKLRQEYDMLISFEELPSDLFSLGVVALQMYHLEQNLHQIYTVKSTVYQNSHVNFRILDQLVARVEDKTLREWVGILLSQEERRRKGIFEVVQKYETNGKQLKLLKENPLKVAPEEELIEPIDPYVESEQLIHERGASIPMNTTSAINFNRPSSSIFPISHQNWSQNSARPSLINDAFPVNSVIRQNAISRAEPRNSRSSSLPSHQRVSSNLTQPQPKVNLHFFQQQPKQPSSNYFNHKPQHDYKQSNLPSFPINGSLMPITNSPSLQSSKIHLESLSESLNRLSSNLKLLIQTQEVQLSKIQQFNQNSAHNYQLNKGNQGSKNRSVKRNNSLYIQKVVPTIPEVQEEHSNITESEFVVEEYQIGTKYEGLKKNGKRNGNGKFYYSEGSCYNGEWKDNKMHGFGVLTYPNGSIAYQGEWRDDQFEGKGILYNNDPTPIERMFDYSDMSQADTVWIMYEGEMHRGKRHGMGKLVLINGQYYEGQFFQDEVQGDGEFNSLNGRKLIGKWQQSILAAVYSCS